MRTDWIIEELEQSQRQRSWLVGIHSLVCVFKLGTGRKVESKMLNKKDFTLLLTAWILFLELSFFFFFKFHTPLPCCYSHCIWMVNKLQNEDDAERGKWISLPGRMTRWFFFSKKFFFSVITFVSHTQVVCNTCIVCIAYTCV